MYLQKQKTKQIQEDRKLPIKVSIRIRPLLKKEQGQETIIKTENVKVNNPIFNQKKFEFDRVFDEASLQVEIYNNLNDCIKQAFDGFNGTILAYGQTGSGKTYTMFGSDWESQMNFGLSHQATYCDDLKNDFSFAGIIPRVIFGLFNNMPPNFYIYCSFLQIYNEKIYDLLQDHKLPMPLNLHESKLDGIYVENLTEYAVNNYHDCLTLMKRGERNRIIRQTTMNLKSSRSHTIFQLIIETNKVDRNGVLFKSKLNLCDLAGSEKINKLEALTNAHFIELKNINQSLTTLGKVIQNLSQNNKNKQKLPIPYRESKLTRLLQDSLGGNTMTHIIVNIAPNIYNIDETVSSLKFAQRAKNVTIQVQPNKFNANDQVLVNKLVKEIDYLKSLLNMKRSGLNQNDLHFKLMKMQEENERLREGQLSNDEVEKIIQENRKMKEELQKLQQQSSFGDPSESNSIVKKMHSDEGFVSDVTTERRPLAYNGMFIISNPSNQQKTEVQVRFKDGRNRVQLKKGYVEISEQQEQRQKRFLSEKRRVMQRLQYLEQLQMKNEMTYSLLSSPSHFHSFQSNDEKKSVKYRLLEQQMIQKQ
ncbi:unnamed protein product (macronuclear) [Paramecium tetraurelia]|uniref:Kinesin-like protein n=1 Tax=Paramecium tetraurelia TaxID=5888 RepID=A0EEV4_PARTE|nr:uncharacterized protein GSPATT00026168001 [Paramecium tetraurelia]CAK93845.1 unnamed protein product [Paramecium tetraurelia]|eukprot:XP_001461218.1 hypothetical protein (macronuclear) [Paramecium tetraurelia strain d4-2]